MELKVTDIRINPKAVENAVNNLLDDDTMLSIQQIFADAIDPWTPFLTGRLSGDITIDSEGVTYNVPYAADKYYGYAYHKEVHPLATSHWDKVAVEQGAMDSIEAQVKELLIARAKALYG